MPVRKVVVLSTADYAGQVWTNKQFIASGLAACYNVHYINSLGLRQPTLGLKDLQRIQARLKPGGGQPSVVRDIPAKLTVHSPLVVPFHGLRPAQLFNRKLLAGLMRRIGITKDDVLWTFSPVTYGIGLEFGSVVYHSVDLLHTIPGVPSGTLLRAERALVRDADVVIASSTGVLRHLVAQGAADPLLWENVADTRLYANNMTSTRQDRAIFAGHFTPSKIDAALFQGILDAGIPIAIAGPVSIDGATLSATESAVLEHPLTTYLGILGPERLAEEVGRSKVGIIPYLLNDYTRGVFPMKVFEYLAGGLPVVTTPLVSLLDREHPGLIIREGSAFVDDVRHELNNFSDVESYERSDYAQRFSWSSRIAQAVALVERI